MRRALGVKLIKLCFMCAQICQNETHLSVCLICTNKKDLNDLQQKFMTTGENKSFHLLHARRVLYDLKKSLQSVNLLEFGSFGMSSLLVFPLLNRIKRFCSF